MIQNVVFLSLSILFILLVQLQRSAGVLDRIRDKVSLDQIY